MTILGNDFPAPNRRQQLTESSFPIWREISGGASMWPWPVGRPVPWVFVNIATRPAFAPWEYPYYNSRRFYYSSCELIKCQHMPHNRQILHNAEYIWRRAGAWSRFWLCLARNVNFGGMKIIPPTQKYWSSTQSSDVCEHPVRDYVQQYSDTRPSSRTNSHCGICLRCQGKE